MTPIHANRYISILYRHGQRYLSSRLEGSDIDVGQLPILAGICNAPGQTQEQLSCFLAIDKGFVARTVTTLEERGYVRRVPDQNDRRANLIYPTSEGISLRESMRQVLIDWQNRMTDGMTPEQISAFGELLKLAASNILQNHGR